jgi:hypothetical protein
MRFENAEGDLLIFPFVVERHAQREAVVRKQVSLAAWARAIVAHGLPHDFATSRELCFLLATQVSLCLDALLFILIVILVFL